MSVADLVDFLILLGLTFVPIFIALDAFGNLPLILAWTSGLTEKELSVTLRHALLTALGVSLAFILSGRAIFLLLGITIDDFMVAGGLVLLVLAIMDLITREPREATSMALGSSLGVVPIGTPLPGRPGNSHHHSHPERAIRAISDRHITPAQPRDRLVSF